MKKGFAKVILPIWTENIGINIVEDSQFTDKYGTKHDASSIQSHCDLLDAKLKTILETLAEMVQPGKIPEDVREGLKALFGPTKVLPRNFFYEFESVRITFSSNLLLSR